MDGRVWTRKAEVFQPDGGSHFYIHTDQRTGARKVMVEVKTVPEGEDLTCQLSTRPLWYIPPPGTIVFVGIPSGEIDHCPEIIGISDSGAADADIDLERTLLATDKDLVLKAPSLFLVDKGADQQLMLGNNYRTAEGTLNTSWQTFLTALSAYVTAIKPIADPTNAATPAMLAAVTAMAAAVAQFEAGPNYLSPSVKTK